MSLQNLKNRLESEFLILAKNSSTSGLTEPGFIDKRLYAIYLTETYHYTKHNARNQALVAARNEELDIRYMKFCLRHAEEEAGHEMMAFHDLKTLGYQIEEKNLPEPLLSTQTLIAYLYRVSTDGHPLARLGYSYWAEQSYEYIQPILDMIAATSGVKKASMTFFNEHSSIDEMHAKVVMETIEKFAKTEKDWFVIEECMVNSLILTARMLGEVLLEFKKLKSNEQTRYQFCESL